MASRLATAIVTASLLLVSNAAPAHAAYPGANGKIAFADQNGLEIADPSGANQITVGPGGSPSWSPDGQRVAYVVANYGSGTDLDIYVANADGSGVTQLTSAPRDETEPTWSPDATKIAYSSSGTPPGLWVMNADGTDQHSLNVSGAGKPSWSPDGSKISFVADADPSPTAYNADIFVVNADGTGLTDLTNSSMAEDVSDWSPNGSKIVFDVCCTNGSYSDVYLMNADGSGRRNLTNTNGHTEGNPAWSPDGRKILYLDICTNPGICDIPPLGSEDDVAIMNADGSNRGAITPGNQPNWQPIAPGPAFEHPQSGSRLQVSLLPEFRQCGTGGNPSNSAHAPPLAVGSCNPPRPWSTVARVGAASVGSSTFTVMPGDTEPTNGDQADVAVDVQISDVRTAAGGDYNPSSTGPDLTEVTRFQLTDSNSGYGGTSGTGTQFELRFPVDCVPTSDPAVGSNCDAHTSVDAVYPGAIEENRSMILQSFRVRIQDSGANGVRGDADDRAFMAQGIFSP